MQKLLYCYAFRILYFKNDIKITIAFSITSKLTQCLRKNLANEVQDS